MKKLSNEERHAKKYAHKSGVSCVDIAERFNYNMGNAIKFIWRADKYKSPIYELEKAKFYLDREIYKRKLDKA